VLTQRIRADVDANVDYHLRSGLPGDATTVMLLYMTMNWLIVEHLTLPEVFTEAQLHDLVERAVERLVPDTEG
jgi:Tetracyclin repressor-like, C-terminal domain